MKFYREVRLDMIKVPQKFLVHTPKVYKMRRARNFFTKYGVLKERILIDKDNNLVDGFTSLLVAHENKLEKVEIVRV